MSASASASGAQAVVCVKGKALDTRSNTCVDCDKTCGTCTAAAPNVCTSCVTAGNVLAGGVCSAPPAGSNVVLAPVTVQVKLSGTVASMTAAVQASFISTTALALNIASSRVSITNIQSGSVIITTQIAPDPACVVSTTSSTCLSAPNPQALAQTLVTQASSPTSTFTTAVATNTGLAVDTTFVSVAQSSYYCSITNTYVATADQCVAPTSAPSSKMSDGMIAMTVILVIFGAALIGVVVWWFFLGGKDKSAEESAAAKAAADAAAAESEMSKRV